MRSIRKFHSFQEQEEADIEYWKNMDGTKKLEILEVIRMNYWAIQNETPTRFQRVYRVIKR